MFMAHESQLILVLKDELEMNMRLIGARNIEELDESMVDTRALATHIGISYSISCLFKCLYQAILSVSQSMTLLSFQKPNCSAHKFKLIDTFSTLYLYQSFSLVCA